VGVLKQKIGFQCFFFLFKEFSAKSLGKKIDFASEGWLVQGGLKQKVSKAVMV